MAEFDMKDFAVAAITPERNRVREARDEVMDVLSEIDKSKLSFPDLKLYVEILKTTSEIQVTSFSEMWPMMYSAFNSAARFKPPTISEYKSE